MSIKISRAHENKQMQLPSPILTRSSFVTSITCPILVTPSAWKTTSDELKSAKERNFAILSSLEGREAATLLLRLRRPGAQFLSSTSWMQSNKYGGQKRQGENFLSCPNGESKCFSRSNNGMFRARRSVFTFIWSKKITPQSVKFRRMKKNSWA